MDIKKKKSPLWMLVPVGAVIVVLSLILIVVTLKTGKKDGGTKDKLVEASAQTGEDLNQSGKGNAKDELKALADKVPAIKFSDEISDILVSMSTEDKVAQLFFVRPESLTGVEGVTAAGETTRKALEEYPVGGIAYFAQNIQNPAQVKTMLANTQKYADELSGIPVFLGVDEEGGETSRVAENNNFKVERYDSMRAIGETGESTQAFKAGETIGSYLKELGFNVDFAPVGDVLTNPSNVVIGSRSFGEDPKLVGEMAGQVIKGLQNTGISSCLKHFPGHGGTNGDTHDGTTVLNESLKDMEKQELLAFQTAIEEEPDFLMAAHISLPQILGDNTPCSLSREILTGLLRGKCGYDGIIITDALEMGAVTKEYDSAQAAVKAIEAGADMLLMPEDFQSAYDGVLSAVKSGQISYERLDQSVGRILRVKTGKIPGN